MRGGCFFERRWLYLKKSSGKEKVEKWNYGVNGWQLTEGWLCGVAI